MEMIVFWASITVSTLYFFFKSRRVDVFTISFFSTVLYFCPLFLGTVPDYPDYVRIPIHSTVYLMAGSLFLSILAASIIWDSIRLKKPDLALEKYDLKLFNLILGIMSLLLTVSFLYLIWQNIEAGLYLANSVSKREILDTLPGHYNFLVYSLIVVAVFCAVLDFKRWLTLIAVSLCLDVILFGMRVHFILAFVAIFLNYCNRKGEIRLISLWMHILAANSLFAVMIVFKQIARPLVNLDFSLIVERLDPSKRIFDFILQGEPFTQVAIISKILEQNFQTSPLTLLNGFSGLFPSIIVETNTIRFYSIFAPLFPDVKEGVLADSIWGQLIAVGGFWFFTGCFVYVSILFSVNYFVNKTKTNPFFWIATVSIPILSFYIHRNDLYYNLVMLKRLVIVAFALWILFSVGKLLIHRLRSFR